MNRESVELTVQLFQTLESVLFHFVWLILLVKYKEMALLPSDF